jgi:class 3 adenylate cyclase
MTEFRTTVIMKTDIVDSTPRMAELSESEIVRLLNEQKQFTSGIILKNKGSIIRGEGDAFWITFPSVTAAVLSAIEMQQNLKAMQAGKGEGRLAIRVVITVGDVLHDADDLHGSAMSLTARIEKITPADEIYLSHGAWLLLPKAEAPTSFVNEFKLKGFPDPEKIYKVEQRHRTRIIKNQYVVFTDVRGWGAYTRSRTVEDVEKFLVQYDILVNEVVLQYGGLVRSYWGDSFFLTFSELDQTLAAMENLVKRWDEMIAAFGLGLTIGIHRGDLNIFRMYVFSEDVQATSMLTAFRFNQPDSGCSILTSQRIKEDASGTNWERNFIEVDRGKITNKIERGIISEFDIYQFVLD